MIERSGILALALLVAGCTTFDIDTQYRKPNATVGDVSAAEWQCRREFADMPRTPGFVVGGFVDAVRVVLEAEERERLIHRCMRAQGYEPSEPAGWAKSLRPDALRALFRD